MAAVKPPLLVLGGAVGVGLLAFGCVSAVRRWSEIATGVGTVAGVFCLVLVIFNEQIKGLVFSFSKSGVKVSVDLKDVTRDEFAHTGLAGLGSTYAFVHNQLAADPYSDHVKIRLQDQLVAIAQQNAFDTPVDADEIKKIIAGSSAAERVLAFGLLTSNPNLVGNPNVELLPLLLTGIENSLSGNEQYHALKATLASWPRLDSASQAKIIAAIRANGFISQDSDRRKLAERIQRLTANS